MNTIYKNKGSILLEAFLAVMIIGIAFSSLFDIGALAIQNSTAIQQSTGANFLLKEGIETARSFRDGTTWATNGLGTVNTGSTNPYHFTLNTDSTPNTWALASGTETIGIYTRKIVFDTVSRDPSTQDIETTYNASHNDPNTRQVTATVTWSNKTLALITYLTNWR